MIPILYCGNAAAFDGIYLSTVSVASHTTHALDVYLFTMDYTERDKRYTPLTPHHRLYLEERLREYHPDTQVRLLDVGELYRTHMGENPNEASQYTPYALLRLLADLVPDLPDKLLYLDTDTMAMGDLATLWHIPVSGYEYAAVRDHYGACFFGFRYINSGVMLWNLALMRESGILEKARRYLKRKKVFLADQTALNRCVKRKKILPRRFNEQKTIRKSTLIRHFSMTIHWFPFRTENIKPWQVDLVHDRLGIHDFDLILEEYLRRKPTFP